MRPHAAAIIRQVLSHPNIEVVPQSRQTFLDALALCEARPDKAYSLTDCASVVTMQERGIAEVLTRDAHFAREGFDLPHG
jgi:predicted nucleic acid-binding protein